MRKENYKERLNTFPSRLLFLRFTSNKRYHRIVQHVAIETIAIAILVPVLVRRSTSIIIEIVTDFRRTLASCYGGRLLIL